jgi:cell division protein FtsW
VNSTTTLVNDNRRYAAQQRTSRSRHPAQRSARSSVTAPAVAPPTGAYYLAMVTVAVFVMLGLVMVLSATSVDQVRDGLSPYGAFREQLLWAAIGLVGLVIALKIRLQLLHRLVPLLLAVGLAGMLATYSPVGHEVEGARAWVKVGGYTAQPAEFMKIALLLYCASALSRRRHELGSVRAVRPVLVVGALATGLCLGQGDLGTAIVLCVIVVISLFIAGAPLLPMVGVGTVAAALASPLIIFDDRRRQRLTAFWDVAAERGDGAYQTYNALIAVAQGGLTGKGPGRGASSLGGYVPSAHNDFIFAVIAEELGMIGIVLVLGGFLLLAYAGMLASSSAPEPFGQILAAGIVGWLLIQMIINVGGVIGLIPVTGLPLPFFSAGGSSLMATMVGAGLLLNIARTARPATVTRRQR